MGLSLSAVFGLISTIGVVYQIWDIRKRARTERLPTEYSAPRATGWSGSPQSPLPSVYPPVRLPSSPFEPPARQSRPEHSNVPPRVPAPKIVPAVGQIPDLANIAAHGQDAQGDATVATPAVIRRTRFLLVAVTVLMIPTVSFYLIGSVTAGNNPQDPFAGPAEWFATICVILSVGVPLAAIPTSLSMLIGRGHN